LKRRKAIGFAVAVGVVVSGVFVRRDIVSAAALNARGSELPLEMVRFVVAALRCCHGFGCGGGALVHFGVADGVSRFIATGVGHEEAERLIA
jgi:hypothetical protein